MNPLPIVFVVLSAFLAEMVASRQEKPPSKIKNDPQVCGCLNGGTCLTYNLFSQIKSCLCPEGYDGDHCEIGWTCGQRNLSKNFKIVGGQKAPIESQPWIATIFLSKWNTFVCAGSLIDPCWVVTAAHCLSSIGSDKSKLIIRLGRSATNASNANDQEFSAEKLIIHEAFTQPNKDYNNDIALIKIRSSSGQCAEESNIVKTICLPSKNLKLKEGFTCEVSGYGKQNKTAIYFSRVLRSADITLMSWLRCKSYYESHRVTENMLCASHWEWRADSCSGDSGGPLTCMSNGRMVLLGIISWGDGCAKKGKPGVYTRVTRYISWIQSNMKPGNKSKRSHANS